MGTTFLDLPVKTLVLPDEVVVVLGCAAAFAGITWLTRAALLFSRGALDTLYAASQATHVNLCTGDPGTTGANEATSARGAITWVGGSTDGTVQGNELTLASVPIGNQ